MAISFIGGGNRSTWNSTIKFTPSPKILKNLNVVFFQDSKLNSDYDQSDELLCQLTQDLSLKLMTLN